MSNSKLTTWDSIIGNVHPEWPGADWPMSPERKERTKQRIRNVAWAHNYSVDDNGVVRKGK